MYAAVFLAAFAAVTQQEVEGLRSQVAAQQAQIDELRARLETQQKLLEKILATALPTPVSTPAEAVATAAPLPDSAAPRAPFSIRLGGASLTPTGFFELSQVWRTRTVSSGLPTSFGAIPFGDTVYRQRRQTLSTAAGTRLGLQMNTRVLGFDVLGVVEADFLGYQPGNVSTSTNSDGLRLRLGFAQLGRGKWEILGGQTWSLLTPGRKGIAPLPQGLFVTQDLDPNLQSGPVWARAPQLRAVYRAAQSFAVGISFESGNTYGGGSAGAGQITLPQAFAATNYFNQVDTGSGGSGVPNPNSDLIAKAAFDPAAGGRTLHFEIAGVLTRYAFYNPLNNRRFSIVGGGAAFNAGIEVLRNLTAFTNNFYTSGAGNYIFGESPDLIIRERAHRPC